MQLTYYRLAATTFLMFATLGACKPKPAENPPVLRAAASASAQSPALATASPSEAPIAAAPAPAMPASILPKQGAFDVSTVPVARTPLPPFPYLDWPIDLPASSRASEYQEFDQAGLIAGNGLRIVEGRVEIRDFFLESAKLSALAVERNYANAIKALGGVQVNAVSRNDPSMANFVETLTGARGSAERYASYLLRSAGKNIWFVVTVSSQQRAYVVTIEEQEMKQSVGATMADVSADAMRSELDQKGHVALYINFDTDKAVIRPDGQPTVGEIARLLKSDPALKLSIEGHTDNNGDAGRSKELSEQRAKAVLTSLITSGIDATRVSASGLGASKPIADNASDAGRAKNRRVELVKQG